MIETRNKPEPKSPERFKRTKRVAALLAASVALAACNNTTPTEVVARPSSAAASANPTPEHTTPSPETSTQKPDIIATERGEITVDAANQASDVLNLIERPDSGSENKDATTIGNGTPPVGVPELSAAYYEADKSITGHDKPTLFVRANGSDPVGAENASDVGSKAVEYQFSLNPESPFVATARAATDADPLTATDFRAALQSDPSSISLDYMRVSEGDTWADLSFNEDTTRAYIESGTLGDTETSQETYMRGDSGFEKPVTAFADHAAATVEQLRQF